MAKTVPLSIPSDIVAQSKNRRARSLVHQLDPLLQSASKDLLQPRAKVIAAILLAARQEG